LHRRLAGGLVLLHFLVDTRGAFGLPGLFLRVVPGAQAFEVLAQADQRLLGPVLLHFLFLAVAAGVVRRGVVGQAIGERLDQRRAAAIARLVQRLFHGVAHRDDVVAVHLDAFEAACDRLLGQRLAGGLDLERHG